MKVAETKQLIVLAFGQTQGTFIFVCLRLLIQCGIYLLLLTDLFVIIIFMATRIPPHMLEHLQYLRGLHLQGPRIGNIYLEDTALLNYLESTPIAKNQKFQKELQRLGDRFASIYLEAAKNAQQNQPRLQQFDSYGRRIDKLHLSEGWRNLAKYSAEDGIVSLAYEKDQFGLGEHQRFGQLVVLYMYHASSGLYGCPLAMTDGAAYTLRNEKNPEFQKAFQRLTSRTNNWTSGQWMTQKKGGSDVSNTETLALKTSEGSFNLYGYKWFTSATDSQMAITLGKIVPADRKPTQQELENTKVSTFFVKVRDDQENLNRLEIIRLKDKLGTQQLPTAQLLLKGTQAQLIGQPGQGVKNISKMLLVTRIWNSATALGVMRRVIALSRDYSSRRFIGKAKLADMPLQVRVLSHLQITHRANLAFYLEMAALFSKQQAGTIQQDEANLLRIFSPILKLFTGKQVLQVCSEGLESFGGMGYIEGTMIPALLRDAQVLSIWQGTTNVLCYDFVRALLKQENQIKPLQSLIKFFSGVFEVIGRGQVKDKTFTGSSRQLVTSYLSIVRELEGAAKVGFKGKFSELRTICFGLARIYISALLQLRALKSMRHIDIEISNRWAKRGLYQPENYSAKDDRQLGLDLNPVNQPRGVGERDKRGVLRPRF